jgi:hypothetical protein
MVNNGLTVKQKPVLQKVDKKETVVAGLGSEIEDTISQKLNNGKEVLTYSGYEMEKVD